MPKDWQDLVVDENDGKVRYDLVDRDGKVVSSDVQVEISSKVLQQGDQYGARAANLVSEIDDDGTPLLRIDCGTYDEQPGHLRLCRQNGGGEIPNAILYGEAKVDSTGRLYIGDKNGTPVAFVVRADLDTAVSSLETRIASVSKVSNDALPKNGSGKMTGDLHISTRQPIIYFEADTGTANIRVVGGSGDMCYQLGAAGKSHIFQTKSGSGAPVWAGDYITSSSKKYKNGIQNVSQKHIEAVKDFNVVEFNRNGASSHTSEIGVIAEEVAEIDDTFVIKDESGNAEAVSLNSTLFAALALIQQQQQEIDELKARLDKLEPKRTNKTKK